MNEMQFTALGLMSGTSLDGLDLALVRFTVGKTWSYSLLRADAVAYDPAWKNRLEGAVSASALELAQLHVDLGQWLGQQVRAFLGSEPVDLVASHGHTVFHQPEKGLTLQIGCPQTLATACGQRLVADFRVKDVTLGGQGAPLVPIGDQLLWGDFAYCLNLGGISNISFEQGGNRLAFDICPFNMLLNRLAGAEGLAYDDGGQLAAHGQVDTALLNRLNALPFYTQAGPKSLGIEWFLAEVWPLFQESQRPTADLLATAVEHAAVQVAAVVEQGPATGQLLATGGGAYNRHFIARLQHHVGHSVEVVVPASDVVDFKEAIVFALMGLLRHMGRTNVLSSVTGARADSSSGVVYLPAELCP